MTFPLRPLAVLLLAASFGGALAQGAAPVDDEAIFHVGGVTMVHNDIRIANQPGQA